MRGRRRIRVVVAVALLLAVGAGAARSRALSAVVKSKRHFLALASDVRVRHEPGAEALAERVAAFLDTAVARVVEGHGFPFSGPIRVWVCATQESLNSYIGLPADVPIRGTVRFGEVFLAPSAFDWLGRDTHRESLMHEMSHLHLRQRLGVIAHRGRIPAWFDEGLADWVSGAGGEGVSRMDAARAILEGPALRPDSTGSLWNLSRAGIYGLSGPMLHRQSLMFLEYLRDLDPGGFSALVADVQRQREFARPFRERFGGSVEEHWAGFAAMLRAAPDPEEPRREDAPGSAGPENLARVGRASLLFH